MELESCSAETNQGIITCSPTNVPLLEMPMAKPYIARGYLWVFSIPKNPQREQLSLDC